MLRIFKDDILDPNQFVITLELVPGPESRGRSIDTVLQIASDAFADERISAVTVTDNPGGNPSLSPDVLGYEIFKIGMDVIVHFTCRDLNRVGIESRALQLARMGIKNILALNGDYSGKGFGGQGAPVFDLDSVSLICMLTMLGERIQAEGDPDEFFIGSAVSPFKSLEAECFAQYAKLCKKVSSGSRFIITQLGYDARKYQELIRLQKKLGIELPTLGSLYVLTPRTARIMHNSKIPGAVVTKQLLHTIQSEWQNKTKGREATIERSARLGVVLKGLGYRGIHLGGIHHSFVTAKRIIDRMEQIEHRWKEYLAEFQYAPRNTYYVYPQLLQSPLPRDKRKPLTIAKSLDVTLYRFLDFVHRLFFNFKAPLASFYAKVCRWLDEHQFNHIFLKLVEDPIKRMVLACQQCGDCGIEHIAFLCPESQCPKHIRNGACGGSCNGMCEVYPDRQCVWVRAYYRLAAVQRLDQMANGCVPPRMWELNKSSSWINFHLQRDHHSASSIISRFCSTLICSIKSFASLRDL